jgi:hypothetical protein
MTRRQSLGFAAPDSAITAGKMTGADFTLKIKSQSTIREPLVIRSGTVTVELNSKL